MTDYPLQEMADYADFVVSNREGAMTYQRWTCAHCGSRQTMDEANSFFTEGICEACGNLTTIEKCGFTLVLRGKR